MRKAQIFGWALALLIIAGISLPQAAFAWCTPRVISCGAVIDSTNRWGHTDVNRYNCTGSTNFNGKADVYEVHHLGGPLSVNLGWTGSGVLWVFVLGSCNQNNCLAADSHNVNFTNLNPGYYWIIVDGKTSTYNRYRLSLYCGDHQLPVELTGFSASSANDGVHVRWSVGSESNNQGFTISRQAAGQDSWERMAFITGRGTAATPADYSFTDPSAIAHVTYNYRLESLDMNGTQEILGERQVEYSVNEPVAVQEFRLLGNYPNPFNPTTMIQFSVPEQQALTLNVYDANGRLVQTLASGTYSAGTHEVSFDGANLATGIYFARMTGNAQTDLLKLMLIK
jgi:hypothetical protein